MGHTESPDFDRLAVDRELTHEARRDREEIKHLRAALKPFADVGRRLRDARVCETGSIPAGASARFLKLEPLIAGDFVQAANAFDAEQGADK